MNLAAVLLAGGESRRMGRDKAMLMIDGVPLWRRQIGVLRELSPAGLFVSGRAAPGWLPDDAVFIADPLPACGPLGGLAATLAAMDATHLVALAVDMPMMTATHLAMLWSVASRGCGVLPWIGDCPEPLPAIYPVEALAHMAGVRAGEDVSLRALTRALVAAGRMKKQAIPLQDASLYANCNSPADWHHHVTQREPVHG
jgi:molybdopterin-guanine dinucleotide biosynthesis protein A